MKRKAAEAAINKAKNYAEVMEYVYSILSGAKIACKELTQACERFLNDLKNPEYDFDPKDAEFVIQIIEKTCTHIKGEDLNGESLVGKPIILQPWQKFIVYNILGFLKKEQKLEDLRRHLSISREKTGKHHSSLRLLGLCHYCKENQGQQCIL